MLHSIAALVGLAALAGSPESTKDANSTLHCKHRAFRIPIDLSNGERSGLAAMRLYVSTDEGKSWTRYGDAAADAQTVTFKSVRDGAYCFALATVNRDGVQAPADMKSVAPGLKVVIDSTAPNLLIKPVRSTAGKRGIRWEVSDDNLDATSLRLAYCPEGSTVWKPLAVRTPEKLMQWFDDGVAVQKMQASVLDRAGNETVQEVEIAGDRFTKSTVATFALPRTTVPEPATKPAYAATSTPWTPPPMARQLAAAAPPPAAKMPEAVAARDKAPAEKPWTPGVQPAGHAQTVNHTAFSPVRPAVNKPRENMLCGAEPIVVNYELDRGTTGTSAVVELWGTRDRGVSWSKLATDSDCVSPIEANLPQDGVWGLKIVTHAAGAAGSGPKSGTEPDTYVESDRLAPAVMVGAAELQRGQVAIRWEASDKNLGPTPISIFYGRTLNGPWSEVAKNVDNVGEYVWNFSRANASGNVYFRVEAVDEAKNTGVSHSPIAVALDGQAASGRVLQVKAGSNSKR